MDIRRYVLHGTWILAGDRPSEGHFFVWAERVVDPATVQPVSEPRGRIIRHPYAATTIEIAHLLDKIHPAQDWHHADRLTRVVYLPSGATGPMPSPAQAHRTVSHAVQTLEIVPWRIEGIEIPSSEILHLLTTWPTEWSADNSSAELGTDMVFWRTAARFALDLLEKGCFLPGLENENGTLRAVWLPMLDSAAYNERFEMLARGMPPACRAVVQERNAPNLTAIPSPQSVLHSFLKTTIDHEVRHWGFDGNGKSAPRIASAHSSRVASAWWRGLQHGTSLPVPTREGKEIERFYTDWKRWAGRSKPSSESPVRLCFRLEPPMLEDVEQDSPSSQRWVLHYLLQAVDEPSLLIPAWEVWQEQSETWGYLSHRFDHPQQKLLEGLRLAADLCPPIRRSLQYAHPDSVTLTDEEAIHFMRESARLLEGAGFGVMVPPWWNMPDARLRLRTSLRTPHDASGSGILGMDAILSYDWEVALGDQTISREEFEQLAALKTPLVQMRGQWVLLQPDQIEALIAFWEKHRDRQELNFQETLNIVLGKQKELDGLAIDEIEIDENLERIVARLKRSEPLEMVNPPRGFHGTLRPYQLQGLSWLVFMRRCGFGACLADDMGLGKTIQAIALILHERERNPQLGPSLVICPTSLVGNWQREVARFAPELRVIVHHGTHRAEGEAFIEQALQSDLVISTYGLVRRDIHDLSQVRWANVIVDEAQNIKNPLTKQARAVRRLQADFRLALTGTPVENRLSELWSIMAFLNPGYLGTWSSFRRNYALPIEKFQDSEAADQLRQLVRPFILRRVKTDPRVIQDLPEKFEQKIYCTLTREQATLYEAIVQNSLAALRESVPGIQRRGLILAMLTRLKQVCNHPALYLADGSEIGQRSGKLNRLTEMLEEILELDERALIFTQYAQMGFLLQQHLQNTYGQEVLFLHGGTPQHQRDELLRRFQESSDAPHIFVLSLKAGGTGLNLMRANHVFHFDRWWNPAVENQATDRAYRIGQMRDVQVHKFICLGTLEERIDALIESKRELAENIISEGDAWLTELSTDELIDLIALRSEAIEAD